MTRYDQNISAKLEAARWDRSEVAFETNYPVSGRLGNQTRSRRANYTIDWQTQEQVNTKTKARRRIRRMVAGHNGGGGGRSAGASPQFAFEDTGLACSLCPTDEMGAADELQQQYLDAHRRVSAHSPGRCSVGCCNKPIGPDDGHTVCGRCGRTVCAVCASFGCSRFALHAQQGQGGAAEVDAVNAAAAASDGGSVSHNVCGECVNDMVDRLGIATTPTSLRDQAVYDYLSNDRLPAWCLAMQQYRSGEQAQALEAQARRDFLPEREKLEHDVERCQAQKHQLEQEAQNLTQQAEAAAADTAGTGGAAAPTPTAAPAAAAAAAGASTTRAPRRLRTGDQVRIVNVNVEEAKRRQKGHGGWCVPWLGCPLVLVTQLAIHSMGAPACSSLTPSPTCPCQEQQRQDERPPRNDADRL